MLVSLTKTAKKGLELKQNLIEEVRACFFVIIIFSQPLYLVLKVGVGLSVRDSCKHPRLSRGLGAASSPMGPEYYCLTPAAPGLQSPMNCPVASEMCGHVQVPLHLLRGQHEEQQAEGHPQRLEAQSVSGQWEAGPGCLKVQGQLVTLGTWVTSIALIRTKCHCPQPMMMDAF